MLVRHFMTRRVVTIEETMVCRKALEFLHDNRIRRAPVLRYGKLFGIVSERDLLRVLPGTIAQIDSRAGIEAERLPVSRVMTTKLITLGPEEHLEDAGRKMLMHKIGGMPVIEKQQLVGFLTESDIFRAFTAMFATRGVLRVSLARMRREGLEPDLVRLVADNGARLRGMITHERPGGEELTVLRLSGGDRERLLGALAEADYSVLEYVDERESDRDAA
ncbi:MAG: CBS domain-containing protein [Planctomycetes bacterium]|nr:CBS domain-containing protein [Planctomycetota bacterium]